MAPLNERLLAEAREAHAAQAQEDLARVRHTEAVRQLHLAGATMGEIGRALGLSQERVHHRRTGRLRVRGPRRRGRPGWGGDPAAEEEWAARPTAAPSGKAGNEERSSCSFCGKAAEQVAGMVASFDVLSAASARTCAWTSSRRS